MYSQKVVVTFNTTDKSIIYTHPKQDDDDAFLFCEDSPNGGGREHQEGALLFLSFQILSLRFCCRRVRRRLSRLHDHRFFVRGRYFLDRTRALLEPSRDESERSSSSSLRRSSLNPVVLFFARERERESLRLKEEEDGARECISIKISFFHH